MAARAVGGVLRVYALFIASGQGGGVCVRLIVSHVFKPGLMVSFDGEAFGNWDLIAPLAISTVDVDDDGYEAWNADGKGNDNDPNLPFIV